MTFWELTELVLFGVIALCYLVIIYLLEKARRQRRRDS